MTTNNKEYKVDYEKHAARTKDQIRTDLMTKCFHLKIDANACAQILFEAGCKPTKASTVLAFYAGRQRYLDNKRSTVATA